MLCLQNTIPETRTTNTDALSKPTAYETRAAQHRNGTSRRTNTMESSRTAKSSQSTESRQHASLTRKASNLSAYGDSSHGDSHRGPDNKRKVANVDMDYDDSNWIHRDKLAQIESKELEEAGFRVPRKTMSRATSSRSSSRHRHEKYAESPQLENGYGEEALGAVAQAPDKRQRTFSPTRVVEEEDIANGMDFELRTPEEVAAEREIMSKQSPRPGTSRIPVKKSSAIPLSTDGQRSRSRAGSAGWATSPQDSQTPHDLADVDDMDGQDQEGFEGPPSTPPTTGATQLQSAKRSPPKARVPGQAAPSSGARKTSVSGARKPSATQQSRGPSATSPSKRPGTSSGRPSTSHAAPEGDPPWLSTMYKPDPRLPPDQQMLPTHAKRLAQEQWEKEGKTGTVYDRDFRLLNDEEPQQPAPPQLQPPQLQTPATNRPERKSSLSHRLASKEKLVDDIGRDDMPVWPLSGPQLQKRTSAATSTGRPGTSGTDHGGYSIMPSLNSPKHPPGSPNPAVPSPKPVEIMRMQDPDSGPQFEEIEKKKGGCGCCVVM